MADADDREPDLLLIDEIYDALQGGDPERALRLAHAALNARAGAEVAEDDPVIRFLAGVALLELDQPSLAVDELTRAVEADPEDAEFRSQLALALFRCCRFEESAEHARAAIASDADLPDAHWGLALALEREGLATGDFSNADRLFARATALDPERFPAATRMTREEFQSHVATAMDRLPAEYRKHFDGVAVTVEELPAEGVLRDEEPPLDPETLGLFVGVPLGEAGQVAELPPRILVFQRALERMALTRDELIEEIAITVWHELGHYLGLDEDELEAIDLG